jgi:hypothetical protein
MDQGSIKLSAGPTRGRKSLITGVVPKAVNCTTIPCGDDLSIHDYCAYSQDMPLEDGSPSQLPYNQHNQGIDPDLLYNGSQQANQDIYRSGVRWWM